VWWVDSTNLVFILTIAATYFNSLLAKRNQEALSQSISKRTKGYKSRCISSDESNSSRRLEANKAQVQSDTSTGSNFDTHRNQPSQVLSDSKHRHEQENETLFKHNNMLKIKAYLEDKKRTFENSNALTSRNTAAIATWYDIFPLPLKLNAERVTLSIMNLTGGVITSFYTYPTTV
jgi:hypothetical protein